MKRTTKYLRKKAFSNCEKKIKKAKKEIEEVLNQLPEAAIDRCLEYMQEDARTERIMPFAGSGRLGITSFGDSDGCSWPFKKIVKYWSECYRPESWQTEEQNEDARQNMQEQADGYRKLGDMMEAAIEKTFKLPRK